MKIVYTLIFLLIPAVSFSRHPIESISAGNTSYRNKELHFKMKVYEQDLASALSSYMKKIVSCSPYLDKDFDQGIRTVVESYLKNNLQVRVNEKTLQLTLKSISWDEESKRSDHAAIFLEVAFPCIDPKSIHSIKVTNSILIGQIDRQTNILKLEIKDQIRMLKFTKGEEIQEISFD